MNSQRGAALIAVISILTVSLMLGVTGMQSSAINERLAGNYKSASNAQMIAESGAAYGMETMLGTPDYFEEHDSGEACEDFAEPGLSEQGRRSVDGDLDWYKVDGIDAEIIGCQYEGEPLYLSWGQVRDGDGAIIAESFVIFGDGDGDNPIKDALDSFGYDKLFEYALLVGGALTVNGGANIDGAVRVGGAYSGNRNQDEIGSLVDNDNSGIISDFGPGGLMPSVDFIDNVKNLVGYPESHAGCFSNDSLGVVYCSGSASFDFGDIKGKSVVVDGNVEVGGSSDGDEVLVISTGNASFSGMGGNRFTGVVWAGGSIVFRGQGGTQYVGSFVSAGSSSFNGGLNIDQLDFDSASPSGQGEVVWNSL